MSAMEKMWCRENLGEKDTSDISSKKDSSKRKLESTIEYLSAYAHLQESEENFKILR